MSTISASTTSSTAYKVTADTTGALVLQTGATPTTAVTISSAQVVTLTNALPVASGGSGVTTSTGSGAVVLGTSPTISSPTINGTPVMDASIITRGTAVASTSGTSISFTALPSWVKRITIMFRSVSTSGTGNPLFQLGTGSTTYTTSGYLGAGSTLDTASVSTAAFTAGFGLNISNAGNVIHGSIVITNIDSNIWVASGVFARSDANTTTTGGSISLGAALTAVRATTSNGTDTFDAGSINILYE